MPIYFHREKDPFGEFSNFYPCRFEICARNVLNDWEFDGSDSENDDADETWKSHNSLTFGDDSSTALVDKVVTVYSAEQGIAWMKAVLMKDDETALLIEQTHSPKKCHELSNETKNFDEKKWKEWRQDIAEYIITEKFNSSDHLRSVLEKTEGYSIAEASADDKVWGIGIGKKKALKGAKWRGENLLGRTLMAVRDNRINGVEPSFLDRRVY